VLRIISLRNAPTTTPQKPQRWRLVSPHVVFRSGTFFFGIVPVALVKSNSTNLASSSNPQKILAPTPNAASSLQG